jgi:DNA anti-recombination protein RmuC
MPTIFDEIKLTVSKILKIYHVFVELHDKDRSLAKEMEEYAMQNEKFGRYYQNLVESSSESVKKYYGHIEALIKLSPALNLCIKDHSAQLEESTKQINLLTEALNRIN